MDQAKRIVELEAQCEWLKEDKRRLKEQVRRAKGEEERVMGKYVKAKGECVETEKRFISGKRKWREEDEKIRGRGWQLEEANRKLHIDIMEDVRSPMNESDEASVKLVDMEATNMQLKVQENVELIKRIEAVETDKKQILAEVSELQKEMNDEAERSFITKNDLDAEKKRSEEVQARNYELAKSIELLEGVKIFILDDISELRRVNLENVSKMSKEKMAAEAEKRVIVENGKKTVALLMKKNEAEKKILVANNSELANKIELLKRVQKVMQEGVSKSKRDMSEKVVKIMKEKMDAQAEKRALEVLIKRMEADTEAKLSQASIKKDAEIRRVLKELVDLREEGTNMKLKVQENVELIKRIETLETDKKQILAEVSELRKEMNDEAERSFITKKDLDAEKKRSEEVQAKNYELAKSIELLEGVKIFMQDDISELKRVNLENVSKMSKEKMAAESEKRVIVENGKKTVALLMKKNEAVKKILEANNSELANKIELLERVQKVMQEGVSNLKRDTSEKVDKITKEKMDAQAEKRALEVLIKRMAADTEAKLSQENMMKDAEIRRVLKELVDLKEEGKNVILKRNEAISILHHKITTLEAQNKIFQGLVMEKEKMVAEVSRLLKEKSDEVERSFSAKEALEAEKKKSEEVEAKNVELGKRIGLLEQIEKDMQDRVSELKRENSEGVIRKITMERMAAIAEKRKFEEDSNKKIAQLVEENKEKEARLCRVNMEKDEEINRILKEQVNLKEQGQAVVLERDEAIKVLIQKNKTLVARNRQLEVDKTILTMKREVEVEYAYPGYRGCT